ncbi:F-box domain,Leucine-rich repeat domain, L domain-like [Cinara cedri]|uniref:F-box domain,Leucine-rich repeat domain, L domain-like n=1 Tax=Cinara cedri TaxID=506608 RepID=A0A5E4M814_9HEMI|nr:F-box domain,Leucine-rich repeat domain, L domain-like [Cinara cedri]
MDNEITFDRLPVEVITHIFVFLQRADRKVASTVCWSCYEASIHPKFLKNEVIILKDLNNHGIQYALEIFSKSLRPFFKFRICGLGISFQDSDDNTANDMTDNLVNKNHWVKTTWPLLAAKVIFLEFFDTVEFADDILPAILNETQQLKVLLIHNLQYSPNNELNKIKRLDSLEQLTLDNFLTDNIDKNKLLGIIPKQLKTICFKSMWSSQLIIKDITNILNYCSFYLESLELINIDVTTELMQSISTIDMRLKKFSLILADTMHYEHDPKILMPLIKTKWPLLDLTLAADCLTDEFIETVFNTFENLQNFKFMKAR